MKENENKKLGVTFNGSVTFNGPMFDIHDNQQVTIVNDQKKEEEEEKESIETADLTTEKAVRYWRKLQKAQLVDEENQPLVSRTQAALIAYELSERLEIRYRWKCFEDFWHRKNIRNDYNDALNQVQSLKFQELLKKLLAD